MKALKFMKTAIFIIVSFIILNLNFQKAPRFKPGDIVLSKVNNRTYKIDSVYHRHLRELPIEKKDIIYCGRDVLNNTSDCNLIERYLDKYP